MHIRKRPSCYDHDTTTAVERSLEMNNVSSQKTLKIARAITERWLGSPVTADVPFAIQVTEAGWEQELSSILQEELRIEITVDEIQAAGSLIKLSDLLESRLPRDPMGRSLVDVYVIVERFAIEELSHNFDYHWYATWKGDVFNRTDSLDDVEIVVRMENAFGFSIPDEDLQKMQVVGETVRYLWERGCRQSFSLRQRPSYVCPGAFIFHEIRRLLVTRAAIPRGAVRLDAQLGDLLPTWYFEFWKEIQVVFSVDLPHGNLLTRSLGFEKRTTLRDLVKLVPSSTM